MTQIDLSNVLFEVLMQKNDSLSKDYFPIPIMQYVLGVLYIKINVTYCIYSWDCIMLH